MENLIISDVCSYQLPQPCQRGGYQDPKDCSKCKCPDGFGGTYCDQYAPPVNGESLISMEI